jgi:Fic family protein
MLFECNQLPSTCFDVISRIDAMHTQLRFQLQQAPRRWTGLLARTTRARALQGSNSIEGFNVSVDDAVAAIEGEEPLDEKTEAWKAVRGYREAMTYILQIAADPQFVHHEAVLRSLQFMMTGYDLKSNPGRWRPGAIYVKQELTGEIVYEGPDSTLLPALVGELVQRLNQPDEQHVLVKAALAHLNLVMIHPFSDGNGRMSRALQTLVLARNGILDPTFCSIEEYLGGNTQAYYAVLAQVGQGSWHPANDALPWIRFCLTAHYRQAETLLRRMKEAQLRAHLFEEELARLRLNDRMIAALMDAVEGLRVRNTTYRSATLLSEAAASRDLAQLASAGLLVAQGEKRGRYYTAGLWLSRIREQTAQVPTVTDPFEQE